MTAGIFAVLTITLTVQALSSNFRNGSHLINSDNIEYTITYEEIMLSTRICSCIKPTQTMKNGLTSASFRKSIKGFKIIHQKNDDMPTVKFTAIIQPKTTVQCLSAYGTKITLNNSKSIEVADGKTAVIQNGLLHIQ